MKQYEIDRLLLKLKQEVINLIEGKITNGYTLILNENQYEDGTKYYFTPIVNEVYLLVFPDSNDRYGIKRSGITVYFRSYPEAINYFANEVMKATLDEDNINTTHIIKFVDTKTFLPTNSNN